MGTRQPPKIVTVGKACPRNIRDFVQWVRIRAISPTVSSRVQVSGLEILSPKKDENFFNNISPNGTISGDDIRLLIGRILQYGYRGGISTSWKSQNESDANCIAHAYATQILIWETIVGERDAGFNHVSTGGYNAVL